jgi:hypothetical protein
VFRRYAAGGKSKNPTARGDTWLSPNWSIGPTRIEAATQGFSTQQLIRAQTAETYGLRLMGFWRWQRCATDELTLSELQQRIVGLFRHTFSCCRRRKTSWPDPVEVSWTDGPDTFRNACRRSFRESGSSVSPRNSRSFPDWANDIEHLVNHLGWPNFALLGNSGVSWTDPEMPPSVCSG